eukprot:TRINITY_DN1758_c0_g2_i1.p1 TRINITY_DN1758_c0_g2~~TRINITY_DN1758_c0_g2_i1.p1  ORF type:complete len:183 (+),score=75.25 TRINITY_DN1758_c0_g2_i1:133-681(+)
MVLVLVIGDFHIPHRALDIPPRFKKMLVPGKVQHIICTGNLTQKETFDYLRSIASDVQVVRGDFDELPNLPDTKVLTIGAMKVGICHGHQIVPWGDDESLHILQRQLDVDILIAGHTHQFQMKNFNNWVYLNPGSATGSYSCGFGDSTPSFVLMDINGANATFYIYEWKNDDVKVEKREFNK